VFPSDATQIRSEYVRLTAQAFHIFVEHVNLEDVSMKGALSHPKALCSKVFQLEKNFVYVLWCIFPEPVLVRGPALSLSTQVSLLCNK